MRKTLLTAAAATLVWSQSFAAVSVKVGYSNIAGEYNYTNTAGLTAAPFVAYTSKTEDIAAGVVTFGGETSMNVNDMFSIGFEVGASMTGEFEFNGENFQTPLAGGVNGNTGDKLLFTFSKLPVLAKFGANFAAGPGTASLGLGVGAVIVAWSVEMTDQRWWDGSAWSNNGSGSKSTVNNLAHSQDINTSSSATPLFAFEIAPAYHYKLNDKSSIGLEIPLQFVSETVISGDRSEVTASPPAGNANPGSPNFINGAGELTIGGLEWGVNVVYTVKM